MAQVVGCFEIARQLSLSVIGGAIFFLLLVLCATFTTVAGSVNALSQQDYVLISLLTAATFAATCAVSTSVVEFANPVRVGFVRGLHAALFVALIATPLCYAYGVVGEHRMGVVLVFAQASVVLAPLSMIGAEMVQRPLLALKYFRRRVAIIGDPAFRDRVQELSGQLLASVEAVGYLDLGWNDRNEAASERRQARDLSASLQEFLRRTDPDEVVVASLDRRAGGAAVGLPVRELLEVKARGIRVVEFSEFWEWATGRIDLVSLRPSWLLFGRGFYITRRMRVTKRVFDILASSILLVIVLPLLLSIYLILKISSPGPALFKQERVGLNGRNFTLLKFRSMVVDAERISGPTWASSRDSRITPFGSFLRSTRLDELPQLWNILKGDMSVVGPRPERAHFVEMLSRSLPFYGLRHCVKPGLTGWAQINYGYAASVYESAQKLSYDLFYVKHCSIFLDLIIIAQTIGVVLWKRGSR